MSQDKSIDTEFQTANIELLQALTNESILRERVLRSNLSGDLYTKCKLPRTSELNIDNYKEAYDRNPVAARVVEVFPKQCWKVQPSIFEDLDPGISTDFEVAFESLGKSLISPESDNLFFQPEESNNPIWNFLKRVDIASGIGSFGALFLGFDDLELSDEAVPVEELIKKSGPVDRENNRVFDVGLQIPVNPNRENKLIQLKVLNEKMIRVGSYNKDDSSPRFGKPEYYQVNLFDPDSEPTNGTVRQSQTWTRVHWTRILHVAELNGSSEEFHIPRLKPVWNAIAGVDKILCSDPEGFYQGNFPGFSIESHPQLGGNVKFDLKEIEKQLEQYSEGFRKWLTMSGAGVNQLAPNVGSPKDHIDMLLEVICIILGIPKRVFLGSERGELSSSQDATEWENTLRGRREDYLTGHLIVPFIERMIWLGALPKPSKYFCVWPVAENLTDLDKAERTEKITRSLVAYVAGNVDSLIKPNKFLSLVVGLSDEEAEEIVNDAQLEDGDSDVDSLEEGSLDEGLDSGIEESEEPENV